MKKNKSIIQSILLDKQKFSQEEAISWITEHGYRPNTSAPNFATTHFWRFRQYEPSSQYEYRTKKIYTGIDFVFAYSKTKGRKKKSKSKTVRKVIKE